ncbi:MAG: acriflavin resistance protein [Bacteroidetes bacterium GWC2_33_15]|nr:MAG: acriflavin resistance protein [Bacteroidetes bacterium GWA2_33_15]OFX48641.1 MAG: acriflavin resistance protein [Bacteroidetes bacterium GWC2_33_15]OFX64615.1 MAG: acriflavin resistance protein [Bacteroidetes bacterium GWB2_32_14]OFX67967.1 MAG: acriflavin resistance protein [Bacteroidetes bacterium GWD2_33_33]HAN18201.1 acriflavin resistance protein [Bacteroidales bacterium]
MSITEIAIKRPTLVVVVFSVLAILGISCYSLLNYELIPKLNFPAISIVTVYPGASANEVESSVSKKLEDALSSLENVKSMQTTSQEGLSSITIELESNADANLAVQDAQRKINAMVANLPTGVKSPSINKFSSDEMPVMKLGVTAKIAPEKLYLLTDNQIKSQLSKLNGVGQVSLVGGNEREIRINVNKNKLDAYKITISQIYQAIYNANIEMPTGKIESDVKQYTVRLLGKVKSLDELRNITVSRTISGSSIKLSDIAEVIDGNAEQSNLNKINGKNSIGIIIQKQSDANSVDVCKRVKEQLKLMENQYANEQLKFDIASDNSTYTLASANAVMKDLMFAILLVAIVMFIFLHSVRNSLIILVSIPASIISVFIAMYIFDFSLNLLTLMALTLVIGILVDDSIVVLENISRHLAMGKDKRTAALDGRNEISFTAVAITMVDICVFLPLSLVSGMIGGMLKEFSLVIIFSTLMSLIVSFTLTPLLASRFGKIQDITKKSIIGAFSRWVETNYKNLVTYYERILHWSLNHRKTVYVTVTVLIGISVSLVGTGLIGTAFMNESDQGEFIVKLEGEPQNTIYQTTQLTQKVENLLLKKPEVVKVFSNIGYSSSDMGTGSNEKNKSEITVNLVPKGQRSISVSEFAAMIKKEVQEIPGLKVSATPSSMMGTADDAPIQVLLRGSDINKLFEVGDSVMKVIKQIPGTNDVKLSIDKSKPELQIKPDREKMEQLGLNIQQVGSTLNLALAGNTDLKYSEGDDDFDINVQFDQFNRQKIDDVGSLTFINNQGKVVELKNFAAITQSLGPNKLERYDRISSLTVKCSVFGRPVGTVGDEIKTAIKEKVHSPEVTIDYKGQMERQSEAFSSLFLAIAAALIFVYLLMVALYNSYLYPFVVMFAIPVAVIGALFALALTGESLTIYSMIGMIMLLGLVTKNAILIVDFTNKLRDEGRTVRKALIEAGKERLRPILMTTFSMIFGMLPIALASGASAESKNGLAWVIIGGLTSSLIFTLVLVPAVYTTMENYKEKFNRIFSRKNQTIAIENHE